MEHIAQVTPEVLEQTELQTKVRPACTLRSDDLGIDAYNDELKSAVEAANAFHQAAQSENPIWLSLLGNCGAGKTQIATALYKRFRCRTVGKPDPHSSTGKREQLQRKQKFTWVYITKTLREGDFGIIDYICDDLDLLVIDDLGAAYDSDLTRAKVSEIAERRIHKPTIWTSNLFLDQIADQIDMRVSSRMMRHGSVVVAFEDTIDWNLQQGRQEAS